LDWKGFELGKGLGVGPVVDVTPRSRDEAATDDHLNSDPANPVSLCDNSNSQSESKSEFQSILEADAGYLNARYASTQSQFAVTRLESALDKLLAQANPDKRVVRELKTELDEARVRADITGRALAYKVEELTLGRHKNATGSF
jgi:hypothetical protein